MENLGMVINALIGSYAFKTVAVAIIIVGAVCIYDNMITRKLGQQEK